MCSFADDNVGLLVFDLCQKVGEGTDCRKSSVSSGWALCAKEGAGQIDLGNIYRTFFLERILRSVALWHIDYAVDIEADLLRVCRPMLVAEAVRVPAIKLRLE